MSLRNETSEHHAFTACEADAGTRLDRFFAGHLKEFSRSRLKQLIKRGHARLNGATIEEPNYRVKPGDALEISVPPAADPVPRPEAIALDILYEDAHLIVIDKPAGLVVHPAAGHWSGTLVNALLAHCGASLSGIGGVRRPGIVHRLDKETSGVMVVAKTDEAHRKLSRQFADHGREGVLQRHYTALAWGVPARPKGVIAAPIGRKREQRQKMAVVQEGGKEAVTHYTVLRRFGPEASPLASALDLALETGRTHQIRVHMAHIGHPLIADPTYGSGFKTKAQLVPPEAQQAIIALGRQALHAASLRFAHPVDGAVLNFEAPVPADIARVIATLGDC